MSEQLARHIEGLLPLRRHVGADRWRAQYGGFAVAARYAGLSHEPAHRLGEWQHGWVSPEENLHPEWVIASDGHGRDRVSWRHRLWVFRRDQEDFLRQHGLRHVRAIGHAYVYLPPPAVARVPGSLLVMPPHSISGSFVDWKPSDYIDYIAAQLLCFDGAVACVSQACLDKGYWRDDFAKLGVPVVAGADVADENSLLRMATLFSAFDYVTMPSIGSQLPYSAYFGAKATIAGPNIEISREALARTDYYKNFPEGLDIAMQVQNREKQRMRLPQFFVDPADAREARAWGEFQLGRDSALSPTELRREMKWTLPWRAAAAALRTFRRIRRPRRKWSADNGE